MNYIYVFIHTRTKKHANIPLQMLSTRAWKLSNPMQALSIRICLLSNHNNYFIHKFQRILVCCWSHYIYRWLQQQTKIFPPALIENEEVLQKNIFFLRIVWRFGIFLLSLQHLPRRRCFQLHREKVILCEGIAAKGDTYM